MKGQAGLSSDFDVRECKTPSHSKVSACDRVLQGNRGCPRHDGMQHASQHVKSPGRARLCFLRWVALAPISLRTKVTASLGRLV